MSLYRNKYRNESVHHQQWNYADAGAYFVTICTKDRLHYFGEIARGEMQLSRIGEIVASEWLKTPEIRPDMNIKLGAWVVMPNHFHGIVIIGKNEYNSSFVVVGTQCIASLQQSASQQQSASLQQSASQQQSAPPTQLPNNSANQFGPQRKNLASIIRGFKSAVTLQGRKILSGFGWQSRFHDHIIRNNSEFVRIENYIITNPKNWKDDSFYHLNTRYRE